jgi:transcription termination/antitermination protein NusG
MPNSFLGRGDVIKWFVLRTFCGQEETVITIFNKILSEFQIVFPRRRIHWRKQGAIIGLVRPLFEGYLFVSVQNNDIEKLDYLLRMHKMNAWLVRSAGGVIVPILAEEKQLILQLMGSTGIVDISQIEIIKGQIKVVKGPLKGLEPVIKKFSKRSQMITLEVPILQTKNQIELAGVLINSEKRQD